MNKAALVRGRRSLFFHDAQDELPAQARTAPTPQAARRGTPAAGMAERGRVAMTNRSDRRTARPRGTRRERVDLIGDAIRRLHPTGAPRDRSPLLRKGRPQRQVIAFSGGQEEGTVGSEASMLTRMTNAAIPPSYTFK